MSFLLEVIIVPFFLVGLLAIYTYLIPVLYQLFMLDEQDLKQKYGASWGLVTGGSSGIGLAIVEKLASQDINVVIVALDNQLLKDAKKSLPAKFPKREFRFVGTDLSKDGYMKSIIEATSDIQVQLIFNNAGYITSSLFCDSTLEQQLANFHTNATCALPITHHFTNILLDNKLKGLVAFTSSSAGFIPGPMSSIYASTKAFITTFAASIAAELKPDGIDVVCVHPSPINTRFYENSTLNAVEFFRKTAVSPEIIADNIWRFAGRFVMCDQGYFSFVAKMLLKVLDWNLLVEIMAHFVSGNDDYLKLKKKRN